MGVGHGNNSSLHLAEWRADWPGKRMMLEVTAILENGVRQWVRYEMVDLNTDDFPVIGDSYEAEYHIARGKVGQAEVRFMKQRPLVDFAVEWMERNRKSHSNAFQD